MGAEKGRIPWNKGIKIDREKYPNMGHWNNHSKLAKENMSKAKRGRIYSIAHRQNISRALKGLDLPNRFKKGHMPWSKNHIYTKEERDKMSLAHKGKVPCLAARRASSKICKARIGPLHPCWRGGWSPLY